MTGIHHIFCAYGGNATVVRGGYDPATGLIEWDPTPELEGSKRMLSGGELNGWLYACIGTDGDPYNDDGGVFWREDGSDPRWHLVHEFENTADFHEDVRGFTAVPHPKGLGYDVGLLALNSLSKIVHIDPIGGDPRNGHVVTEELNIQQFLGDLWNNGLPLDEDNIIAAYNDMPELVDPTTGDPVHIIGLWVKHHPEGPESEAGKSSWYLIRRLDATFDWGQVIDPANPRTAPLRGCRAARPSPFPEEAGRVVSQRLRCRQPLLAQHGLDLPRRTSQGSPGLRARECQRRRHDRPRRRDLPAQLPLRRRTAPVMRADRRCERRQQRRHRGPHRRAQLPLHRRAGARRAGRRVRYGPDAGGEHRGRSVVRVLSAVRGVEVGAYAFQVEKTLSIASAKRR